MNLLLSSSAVTGKSFPAVPTREEVCGVNIRFQGLVVTIDGTKYPWFEPALQCMNKAQRAQVYSQKKPDTHIIVEFFPGGSIYDEPGQPYQDFISPDFESDPQRFLELIEEIRLNGFQVGVVYNGDNADDPSDGFPNALRQLPILYNLLKASKYRDLNQDALMLRFWDGVFYGSAPENIVKFGTEFRKLSPEGYLGIEHNPGHIPIGEGGDDYKPGGRMDAYDVIFSEYNDISDDPNEGDDTVWQVNGRMVNGYKRPSDQPINDDPNPPFYLIPSPRGERYHCAFEHGFHFGAYPWVRVNMNNYFPLQEKIIARRNYMRAMGCRYTG